MFANWFFQAFAVSFRETMPRFYHRKGLRYDDTTRDYLSMLQMGDEL